MLPTTRIFILCAIASLRLCVLVFKYNAKARRRRDAKGVVNLCLHVFRVCSRIQPTITILPCFLKWIRNGEGAKLQMSATWRFCALPGHVSKSGILMAGCGCGVMWFRSLISLLIGINAPHFSSVTSSPLQVAGLPDS